MVKGNTHSKIILGIDPGTAITGYSIISVVKDEFKLISMGIIDLRKKTETFDKLAELEKHMSHILDHYLPDEVALEAPFFGKNAQSMLKLGRAQGLCMGLALHKRIPVFEYAPKSVKQSVTGNGNASKEQVSAMVKNLLKLQVLPSKFDATDAAAIAICHHFTAGKTSNNEKHFGSWGAFLSQNPNKVLKPK